ncbi:uncharacterized protein CLUP02_10611 [Colletotrichum lupini]|uniref:Uncharacterized protein n=1 Tax=Colletotrichum lupini TaxID=145971 RepID=A0A9Q8WJQ6_9PEZI|nr:uncharacterized protein CLUP02_10611 [Colletotrichum lupini]UQC85115.1 hypothetical protein CLUP02_10611 [Colletotrichum lupini]
MTLWRSVQAGTHCHDFVSVSRKLSDQETTANQPPVSYLRSHERILLLCEDMKDDESLLVAYNISFYLYVAGHKRHTPIEKMKPRCGTISGMIFELSFGLLIVSSCPRLLHDSMFCYAPAALLQWKDEVHSTPVAYTMALGTPPRLPAKPSAPTTCCVITIPLPLPEIRSIRYIIQRQIIQAKQMSAEKERGNILSDSAKTLV